MPAAENRRHAFKRLHELGHQVVAQVDTRLLAGEPPSKIATWLQDDLGVLKDLKTESIKKNLERYRALDLKDKVVLELVERAAPMTVNGLKKKITAYDRLTQAADIQWGRIEILLGREKNAINAGVPLKVVTDEMRLFKDYAAELGKIELEIGVMKRVPRSGSGVVWNPDTGETQVFAWTEEQEALYRELESMGDVVDVVPDSVEFADE